MIRKKPIGITWDIYGIVNNPSKETLEKELYRLSKIQKEEFNKNDSITNTSLINRQNKINKIKERLGIT